MTLSPNIPTSQQVVHRSVTLSNARDELLGCSWHVWVESPPGDSFFLERLPKGTRYPLNLWVLGVGPCSLGLVSAFEDASRSEESEAHWNGWIALQECFTRVFLFSVIRGSHKTLKVPQVCPTRASWRSVHQERLTKVS